MSSNVKPTGKPNSILFNGVTSKLMDFTLAGFTAYDLLELDLSAFAVQGIYAISFGYLRFDSPDIFEFASEHNRQIGFIETASGDETVYHRWIIENGVMKFQVFNPNSGSIVPITPYNTAVIRYLVLTT